MLCWPKGLGQQLVSESEDNVYGLYRVSSSRAQSESLPIVCVVNGSGSGPINQNLWVFVQGRREQTNGKVDILN